MGVDLGKFQDFTVIIVLKIEDGHSNVVYFDRFNKIDWTLQKLKIQNVAKTYGCPCIVDSTGVGDSVFEDLVKMGVNAKGFRIKSNDIKVTLVEHLIIALENEEVSFPVIPELINELRIFTYDYNETSGKVHYNAPSGLHDDIVIALCLALQHTKRQPMFAFGVQWGQPETKGYALNLLNNI